VLRLAAEGLGVDPNDDGIGPGRVRRHGAQGLGYAESGSCHLRNYLGISRSHIRRMESAPKALFRTK
jgi:hypothetical protein